MSSQIPSVCRVKDFEDYEIFSDGRVLSYRPDNIWWRNTSGFTQYWMVSYCLETTTMSGTQRVMTSLYTNTDGSSQTTQYAKSQWVVPDENTSAYNPSGTAIIRMNNNDYVMVRIIDGNGSIAQTNRFQIRVLA